MALLDEANLAAEAEKRAKALRPRVEVEEITMLRLLLTNMLPKLVTEKTMTLEAYKRIVAEIKRRKTARSLELVGIVQSRGLPEYSCIAAPGDGWDVPCDGIYESLRTDAHSAGVRRAVPVAQGSDQARASLVELVHEAGV